MIDFLPEASIPYPKLNPYRAQTTVELISVICAHHIFYCSAVAGDIDELNVPSVAKFVE